MHRRTLLLTAAAMTVISSTSSHAADAPRAPKAIVAELAPSGVLRAGINLGNPVLAQQDAAGKLTGISVNLAQALGKELGVKVQLTPYHEAGVTFAAGVAGGWDVAFLAIDPQRAEQVDFTAPYVIIEGTYMVWADSAYHTVADVDRDGVRITAPTGSAYELYLTRTLKHASLVRTPTVVGATQTFRDQHIEATAGVGAALQMAAKGHPEWRIIEPGFQTIRQAVVLPKGKPADAKAYVADFVERMKASGFVRKGLDETGQADAEVAPPGP